MRRKDALKLLELRFKALVVFTNREEHESGYKLMTVFGITTDRQTKMINEKCDCIEFVSGEGIDTIGRKMLVVDTCNASFVRYWTPLSFKIIHNDESVMVQVAES